MAGRDVQDILRAGGGTTIGGAGLRTRSVLLTVQIALAVTLLAVTALLTMSFTRLLRSDRGFSPEGVVAVDVSMPAGRYGDPDKVAAAYRQLLERIQAIPGISSASWVSALPLSGENWVDVIQVTDDARPFTQMPTANYRFIAPDYFKTMGMPLRRGGSFTDADRERATTLPSSRSGPRQSHGRESIRSDAGFCGATRRTNRSRWSGSSPTVTTRRSTLSHR